MYALIIVLTTFLISIAIIPISPTKSLAHKDGCHRWHSCPSHDGSYVCGDLGYQDECGGSEGDEEEESDNADTRSRDNGVMVTKVMAIMESKFLPLQLSAKDKPIASQVRLQT